MILRIADDVIAETVLSFLKRFLKVFMFCAEIFARCRAILRARVFTKKFEKANLDDTRQFFKVVIEARKLF
jgi:hypothetical protein